jgi:hypothetical protein
VCTPWKARLSPMESDLSFASRRFYKRENDHLERHQLSQGHSRSFWDGDFAGVNPEPVGWNYGLITGLNCSAQHSVETLYKATRIIQSQTFD